MRTLHCDIENCESVIDIPNNHAISKDWASITVSGNIPRENSNMNIVVSERKDICPEHVDTMFDYENEEPNSLKEQLKDAMSDYVQDLAIDAVQEAVENQ